MMVFHYLFLIQRIELHTYMGPRRSSENSAAHLLAQHLSTPAVDRGHYHQYLCCLNRSEYCPFYG